MFIIGAWNIYESRDEAHFFFLYSQSIAASDCNFLGLFFPLNAWCFYRINFSFFFLSIFSCRYDSLLGCFLIFSNRGERYYKSSDKDWQDKRRVSITRTIRHCNVWRSRTSKEIVIPTMGSDLRGRSDGASRRSHPRTLVARNSFLLVVYKGTTMPRRWVTWYVEVNFPAVREKLRPIKYTTIAESCEPWKFNRWRLIF